MIYTAENIDTFDSSQQYDVVIIGSGAGGAMAAAKLAQAGKKVLIVEEGKYVTYEDLNQDDKKLLPLLYRRSAALGTDDFSLKILQGKTWGGSTTINWMSSFRTPTNVLEEWNTEFGLDEFLPTKLESYFDTIENRLNVHQEPVENVYGQNLMLRRGATNLKIHHDIIPNNSKDCIGCGSCGLGCHYDAKQDMRLTYLKDGLDSGLDALTETKAEQINYHSRTSQEVVLKHVPYVKSESKIIYKIKTSTTIVAAGAIFSPLILQASGLTKSKQLGKYFHVHPTSATVALYDEDIYPSYGIPQTVYSKEYGNFDGNGYGWWQEVADIEPFLAGINYPAVGPDRHDGMKQLTKQAMVITLVRDGSDKKSTGTIRWKRGLNLKASSFTPYPIPSINYKLQGTDLEHMKLGLKNNIEIQFAAGAKKVYTLHNKNNLFLKPEESERVMNLATGPNQLTVFSAHPMGTCRMGSDSNTSVVGQDLQMHHYPGVYVMDGSVLPTALGVNPMLTILATISRGIDISGLI